MIRISRTPKHSLSDIHPGHICITVGLFTFGP